MIEQVYVDLDGVLVDFHRSALVAHQRPEVRFTQWNIWEDMGLASEDEFWHPIHRLGSMFWAELDWTSDGRSLLAAVEEIFGADNVCLLSAPCRDPFSATGKLQWIKQHIPHYERRYLLGPKKEFVAAPGRLLLDDGDHNITSWRKRGGVGLLVPRPWNAARGVVWDPATIVHEFVATLAN